MIEVFADITCPFTHVGLRRFFARRNARGAEQQRLVVSSWPLELVNGEPFRGASLVPKIDAQRRTVAPELFAGFDPDRFPASSLPALALVAAAYERDPLAGERLSLAIRTALFEDGADICDPAVLAGLASRCGLPGLEGDDERVITDWHRGESLGVTGSPHFFADGQDFFCPTLEITHGEGGLSVGFDPEGLDRFLDAALS
jgi:predicted DsbA family dithiol-disulfide isomerase